MTLRRKPTRRKPGHLRCDQCGAGPPSGTSLWFYDMGERLCEACWRARQDQIHNALGNVRDVRDIKDSADEDPTP